MMKLYWAVLAMMMQLSPTEAPIERHGALATAIATVAIEEAPLFSGDDSRERTASLLVAVAFRESSFTASITGDGGHSVCAMQIYDGGQALNDDPIVCVRTGFRMLKQSIRVDRLNPVAFYARGPRFKGDEAQRISRDRMALAQSLISR